MGPWTCGPPSPLRSWLPAPRIALASRPWLRSLGALPAAVAAALALWWLRVPTLGEPGEVATMLGSVVGAMLVLVPPSWVAGAGMAAGAVVAAGLSDEPWLGVGAGLAVVVGGYAVGRFPASWPSSTGRRSRPPRPS